MTSVPMPPAPYAPALYTPKSSLVPGLAAPDCRACVAIPVRNEEAHLAACLDALAEQVDTQGKPLPHALYEILLLLNNCTDDSVGAALRWQGSRPEMALHFAERTFAPEVAHAGTARRLLLDTAWQRLQGTRPAPCALLCTDADSVVAPDWIAQNLCALERGADAVGGRIELNAAGLQSLPAALRRSYERDREYGELVAHLEDLLDPQPGDPWPRHQHHFGSSLACTPEAYAAVGGMPDCPMLEDQAFVHRLWQAGLRLRHEPAAHIFTSARLDGRAEVGLSWQLRMWSTLPSEQAHRVQSAAFLAHRFETLRALRTAFSLHGLQGISFPTAEWRRWGDAALQAQQNLQEFLAAIDVDALIDRTFTGQREQPIREAISALRVRIATFQKARKVQD